jgi:hypothetical protein
MEEALEIIGQEVSVNRIKKANEWSEEERYLVLLIRNRRGRYGSGSVGDSDGDKGKYNNR